MATNASGQIIGNGPNGTIEDNYGVKYTRILREALQQLRSLVEPWVTFMPGCKGRSVSLPDVADLELDDATARIFQIVMGDELGIGNRHMKPRHMFKQVPFSNLADPMYNTDIDFNVSVIVNQLKHAIERAKDRVILGVRFDSTKNDWVKNTLDSSAAGTPYNASTAGGILGTNYVGRDCDGLISLPDAPGVGQKAEDVNIVEYNFKYSGTKTDTGMLLDKIVRGIQLLKKKHALVKGVTTPVIGMTGQQIAEIQMWESAQNKNYGFGNLVDGIKNRVLGVNIMETEMLPVATVGTGQSAKTFRICPMWIKELVYFGPWMDARIQVDADLQAYNGAGQVKCNVALGATRATEKAVVQIQCLENLAVDPT